MKKDKKKDVYRIKEYDMVNDIYVLERHVFWFFWEYCGAGSKAKLKRAISDVGGVENVNL